MSYSKWFKADIRKYHKGRSRKDAYANVLEPQKPDEAGRAKHHEEPICPNDKRYVKKFDT
jgi:hypothetical protein